MAYGTRAGIETIFGKTNVSKWSDVDNDKDPAKITARITWALALAEVEVNDKLKDGPYIIPFTGTPDTRIVDITNRLAGVLLYDSRGIVDADANENHQLQFHRNHVNKVITDIHNNKIRLASPVYNVKTYPFAINEGD